MRRSLALTIGLLLLIGCSDGAAPPVLPGRVALLGDVHDSLGRPLIGALIAPTFAPPPTSGAPGPTLLVRPSLPLQTDDAGHFRTTISLTGGLGDTLYVGVGPASCGSNNYQAWVPVPVGERTPADTAFAINVVLPAAAALPSPADSALCAFDLDPGNSLDYTNYFYLDPALTHQDSSGTYLGGRWDHYTSGSTIGPVGSFTGVITPTSLVLVLTYDVPYPGCGSTQRLIGAVLPTGQWGLIHNVSDPACPVGTVPMALARY